jgi:hypothetical protein
MLQESDMNGETIFINWKRNKDQVYKFRQIYQKVFTLCLASAVIFRK